uniref:Ankyrin repeat domain-containing protein n=1 Tax=Globodera rostochiensis TaxID=31243 RepID=A0A914HII7_GLORO
MIVELQIVLIVLLLALSAYSVPPELEKVRELINACRVGDVYTVEKLAEEGVNINYADATGLTPLMTASAYGQVAIVRTLLKRKANFETRDNDGYTALSHAVVQNQLEVCKLLVNSGADINLPRRSPWSIALLTDGTLKIAEFFVHERHSVNVRDIKGRTGLMIAAKHGKRAAVEFLIDNGADPTLHDNSGRTALDWANFSVQAAQEDGANFSEQQSVANYLSQI